jgi:Protein of unknown function (DUF998)
VGQRRPLVVRLAALAGILGPVAFTLAWIAASLLQRTSATAVQISGLAAEDARDPWIMLTGFVLLGAGAVAFGAGLRLALGGAGQAGVVPVLIQAAGVLAIAAGLVRRDHVLLTSGPESWHNHAHDVVAAACYLLLVAAPLLLARRVWHQPGWHSLAVPLLACAAASAALLVLFYAAPHESWDGVVQRVAVTLPLAALVTVAIRMARASSDLA